jgi:pyruvate dehydrogenase E1 component alpha subunit
MADTMNATAAGLSRSDAIPAEARLAMHWSMLRVRRIEEAIIRLYPEQEIRCPTHICIGHEAIAAGVSAHLTHEDYAFSGHRSHGHYLAKGGDLKSMFAELYGRETGCAHGRGGSQHLIDLEAGFVASAPILAGMVPIAVGTALGARWRGLKGISVTYIGDGTTEEGSFHEALNYAATEKLPVIFVCENNLYSVHSDLTVRQPKRPISDLAKGHAMPGETADGNDSEAVWRIAKKAIARARAGGGPSLLEFMTYRWYEHCGTNLDTKLGYRSEAEFAEWQERCPVRRSEARLRREGLLTDKALDAAEARIAAEIEQAVSFAKASPFPDPATLFQNVLPS